jgi:hypothetical protein
MFAVTSGARAVSYGQDIVRRSNMAGTARIHEAESTAPYGYAMKRFSRKMLGEVPGPVPW